MDDPDHREEDLVLEETRIGHGDPGTSQSSELSGPLTTASNRYRIMKVVGRGGFGIVYAAMDTQLHRQVAVKIPHAREVNDPGRRDL